MVMIITRISPRNRIGRLHASRKIRDNLIHRIKPTCTVACRRFRECLATTARVIIAVFTCYWFFVGGSGFIVVVVVCWDWRGPARLWHYDRGGVLCVSPNSIFICISHSHVSYTTLHTFSYVKNIYCHHFLLESYYNQRKSNARRAAGPKNMQKEKAVVCLLLHSVTNRQ